MEWRKWYADVILVPLGVFMATAYHGFVWYRVKNRPLHTTVGVNSIGRRLWFHGIVKENGKKNMIAVQTLRQSIMGSTLMATASLLLSCGLAAVLSSTYSVKKPLSDTAYGAHGELIVAAKYVSLSTMFLSSFACQTLALRLLIQVNYLVITTQFQSPFITPRYVCEMFERGCAFNAIGNRAFYTAFPLLVWISGPIPAFLCSVATVPVLYHLDFNFVSKAAGPEPCPESGADGVDFVLV